MDIVWQQVPDCVLFLTGWHPENKSAGWIYAELARRSISHRVKLLGYLPRAELLRQYQCSWALLIPLFQDLRSQARFPTKIGEYLVSGRPIITTQVGEISEYFQDGINAYVCEPDNPAIFGFEIIKALKDPEEAKNVGQQGVITAQKCFDYRLFSKDIYDFFLNLHGR
jgi:glycosyltransferase involved in cell wall biosynthesis